jgi:hypothetical protein
MNFSWNRFIGMSLKKETQHQHHSYIIHFGIDGGQQKMGRSQRHLRQLESWTGAETENLNFSRWQISTTKLSMQL